MSKFCNDMAYYNTLNPYGIQQAYLPSQTTRFYNPNYDKENIKPNNDYKKNPQIPRSINTSKNELSEFNSSNILNIPQTSLNTDMKNTILKQPLLFPSFEKCQHNNVRKYHRTYCKDCSLFLPKVILKKQPNP